MAPDQFNAQYGKGQVTLRTDALRATKTSGEHLADDLRATFQSKTYQPPKLPVVAMKLLELSRLPEVSVGATVALLETDPMIAGRILRVVQSPIYASRASISSLKQAVIRLGLNTMRDIVLEDAMNLKMFRSRVFGDWMEAVRKHSAVTGHCSRIVAKAGDAPGEFAFMCGLFHDIGTAAILIALTSQKREVAPAEAAEVIRHLHAPASKLLTNMWELPESIPSIVGGHHGLASASPQPQLSATITLAEELATGAGAAALPVDQFPGIDSSAPHVIEDARRVLSIDDRAWDSLQLQAEAVVSHVS
ncbi:MAG: HD-like signal output (HDOD) protein [Bradymonadia bacterium]|jgi:HD-like signal output (HDOD) protein